jgi:cell division septation protein DedD
LSLTLEARVKERLTGAIILVALLVLLVPELLTGPSSESSAKPAGDNSAPVRTYTIDLADDPAANRRANANPAPAQEAAVTNEPIGAASPETATEPESVAAADMPAESDVPATAAAQESASSDLGVAHGSTADPEAAKPVEPRAATRGPGSAAPEPKPVAPEPERPRSAFGPGAAPHAEPVKPPAPARVEARRPAASKGGWSVQLGAFGSRENAERLVKQVKGKGFPVAINENASSKLRYRVRVGPERDRAAADVLAAKLRAAGHKDATVIPPG